MKKVLVSVSALPRRKGKRSVIFGGDAEPGSLSDSTLPGEAGGREIFPDPLGKGWTGKFFVMFVVFVVSVVFVVFVVLKAKIATARSGGIAIPIQETAFIITIMTAALNRHFFCVLGGGNIGDLRGSEINRVAEISREGHLGCG